MKRRTGQDRSITSAWKPATQAIRGGTARSEWGETSEALFLTSGYAYDCADDAAARFAGEQAGMTYSRLQNPTVEMLEQRIALLEGAEACRTTASGMAAMTAALLCQLQAGDHLVGGRAAFGSCRWLTDTLLPKFGIATTVVDARDPQAFVDAVRPETKVFFFETPANPTMDVVDLAAVCDIARERGITTVVDNAFATPALQRPMEYGADVVAYSATKMMDGQGRVLAGAICGTRDWIEGTLLPFTRNTGPTLSPFNAWVVLKGLETLDLRIRRQSENSVRVGTFLEGRVPRVLRVARQSRVQHPRHPRFQETADRDRVLRLTANAQVERLQPLQHHPGVERRQRRPGVAREGQQRVVDPVLRPAHRARQHAALPVHHLGRGIGGDVRAELHRPLQRRRREGVVDHRGDPPLPRDAAHRR